MAATGCLLACAATAVAAVEVDFRHSNSAATNANQNTGTITLAFSVDGSGNVTLDASCANTGPAANVDEFDGPCGTISDTAMWGRNFTITLTSSGSGATSLRVSNLTTGLSVQGLNAHLLDAANEQITATVAGLGTKFRLLGVGHANATTSAGTEMNVSGTAHALTGATGMVDVSDRGINGTFTIDSATDADGQGFVLSKLAFDVVGDPPPPLAASDVVVSFANSGSGFGPTPPFVLSGANAATIKLDFAISNAGVVSLDASTTGVTGTGAAVFNAMVNEWDHSNVGTMTNSAWFNKSFTLTGRGSGGGNLTITGLGGGGIGIQGENSNRVDGLNYGPEGTTSAPETLTWTLGGAPDGMKLNFKNWSYVEGGGSDIRVSNGATNADFPNMTEAMGTLDLPADFTLSNGGSLTFKEIPDIGPTDGAGIAGFTFAIVSPMVPEGFDNGAGDHLWTNAANWNPDGVPAAPASAVIDGHNVILNSVAPTSPDELRIGAGSLTVTGSGALAMRAMTLGRDLSKAARLVLDGSGISFGSNGSSPGDEFAVGSAGRLETRPDSGGSTPLQLGNAKLVLDPGAEWIVDGTNAAGFSYNIGDRFVLANFGSFEGSTSAIRTRNFNMPANRRLHLVVTSSTIYCEVLAWTAATGPNIIIINTDDQAADQHFGFDGRNCLTPTMDSLVSTGLKFNLAFCSSPVCGASRYSLLTSRWPSRNTSQNFIDKYPLGTLGRFGVSDTELERDGQNIGAWLQQAGYRTGFVGKCHVLDDALHSTSNWASRGLITYGKTVDPALDATVNAAMMHNHRVVCQMMRERGFDFVDGFYHANLKELENDFLNVHNQEWITSRALQFIDENRNERFFLYMAPTINHGPVRNDLGKTLRADPRYTSAGFLPNEDYSFMPKRQAIIDQVTAANKPLISARETWLDHSIQAILNKLTAHGIRNDTLIIFTSDHGEKDSPNSPTSATVWGKTTLYDLGMKVPLFMNWPNGIANPGRAYNELVSHVDIPSTLLALAGASGLPTRPVDGVSLVPVFDGTSAPVRDAVLGEIGYARGVRTKTHKYIAVRYTPAIYDQIASGYLWQKFNADGTPTGQFTEPRPYYVNNSSLGALGAQNNTHYYADDQLFAVNSDPNENQNIYGQEPAVAYDLKIRLAHYIGGMPGRPFRQFSDSSTEFSPAPASPPSAPGSPQMQFLNPNSVRLTWSDSANSELGYVIRKTLNGGTPVIVGELPSGATTATVALDPGIEDMVLEVASYNTEGESGVNHDLLLPESWRFRTFGGEDPTLILPTSQWNHDPDGDGVATLWEYAFGTNPLLGSSVARPELRIGSQGGHSFLEYLVPRQRRRGLEVVGSVSSGLDAGWQSGPPHCVIAEDGENHILFRSMTPTGEQPRQFIRAVITNPPGGEP